MKERDMLKKQASNSDLMGNSTKYSDNYRGAITERDDVELKKAKMEEVRQIINALKDKLMERHLMSKKITDLENILQKINNATNKIIIEMNNRVDDLNRDWQERLKNENVKWENDIHSSNKSCNKLTESKSSYKIDKGLRQMERHLFKLTNRLSSIPKMEQKLDEIIGILQRNYCYRSIPATNKSHISKSESIGNTTKTAKNMQNNSPIAKISDYYGVVEITENYYLCLRNLERAIKSLESVKQMLELFGVSIEGISNIEDINYTISVLKQFVNKLKFSLHKCNLRHDDVSF